jgi:DNA-binding IclR family transcriptional regulator
LPQSPVKAAGYQAPAVRKAFALLRAVADAQNPPSLSGLARTLGFSKGTTHGLVSALMAEDAIEHESTGSRFLLGPALADLAMKTWNVFGLTESLQPLLDTLRDQVEETVFLGVMTRSRAVIVARAEADRPIKISSPPGTALPLMAGAVGKVFLAPMDNARAQRYIQRLGLYRHTDRSITDEVDFLEELQRVRKNGYALDDEEYLPGVRAVAVAVGNRRGLPMAVWGVGFSNDLRPEKIGNIAARIQSAAGKMASLVDRIRAES